MGWGGRLLTLVILGVPSGRFVIQLLEDLVFFVSDVPNNGQNVLDIMVTKPNRERQKLMREQNILKQVPAHEEAAGTKRQRLFCLQLVSSCALPAVSHHLFFFFPPLATACSG